MMLIVLKGTGHLFYRRGLCSDSPGDFRVLSVMYTSLVGIPCKSCVLINASITRENKISILRFAPHFILKIPLISNLWGWLNFKYNVYTRDSIARRSSKEKSKFLQMVHEKIGSKETTQTLKINCFKAKTLHYFRYHCDSILQS